MPARREAAARLRAVYDPLRVEIVAATPYEHAHEWAHVEQEARRTLIWRLWTAARKTPLWPFPCFLLELQAAIMARRAMRHCGIWEPDDRWEALGALLTYAAPFFH